MNDIELVIDGSEWGPFAIIIHSISKPCINTLRVKLCHRFGWRIDIKATAILFRLSGYLVGSEIFCYNSRNLGFDT